MGTIHLLILLQVVISNGLAENQLNITDVRLGYEYYDAKIPLEGLVELLVNDTWGTICNNNITNSTANVICRMLGLEIISFYTHDDSYRNSGPIYIGNLYCTGSESHVNECSYDVGGSCTHEDDLAVICTDYQFNITDVRLVGSSGPYHGSVELNVNGTWLPVVEYHFHPYYFVNDVQIVCHTLGLEYYDLNVYEINGSGKMVIDRLDCPDIIDISQCRYSMKRHFDNYHYGYSVTCFGPPLNITDVRLVNGSSVNNGRVEIKINDTWGTICDKRFDKYNADLICNKFGLRAAQYFTGAYFGEGSGPIYIDELHCDGNEQNLSSCSYVHKNECTHEMDVSVLCNECGEHEFSNDVSTLFSYSGSTLYVDCDVYRTYVGTIQLTCNNITQSWVKEEECKQYSFPLTITDIRLVDGPRASVGRVEIKSLDTWGTICHYSFGMSEANVICKMLGYPHAVNFHYSAYFGEGVGPIFVAYLDCVDNNSLHLNNCTYRTDDNCYHRQDVSVTCLACEDVVIANGYVNSSATNYEAAIKIECDSSYQLIGDSVIICQLNGSWSHPFPICLFLGCGDPLPENGFGNTPATIIGTVVMVRCNEGYDLVGDNILVCQENKTWTDKPMCQIKDCGPLQAPINGNINDNEGTTYNAEVQFSCMPGYFLIGAKVAKCEETGEWSYTPPSCVEKSKLGGYCISKDYCLPEGAMCANNVCVCSSGIVDTRTNKCDTMPLMSFGAAQGDYILSKQATCGPKITFQPGFPIENKLHTDLYVCRFGYISFDEIYLNPSPPKSMKLINRDRMLLAPFYGPIDIQKSGPVSYKTFDILNSYNKMKENVDIVSNIEMFVRKFGNLDRFNASFILIATWNNTVPYTRGFDNSKTSTFQVILVSDGKVTYSLFIYGNGMMNWEYTLSTAPPVWVGNSLDSVIYTNPYAFTKNALKLDTISSSISSTTEVSGLVFRSLNEPGTIHDNSAVDCINWYNQNYQYKKDIDYFARTMPECPCDIQLSRFDPWFWRIGLYRWRFDLHYKCIDMLPLGNFGQYGKSCCYDLKSRRLILERPLAGSFHLYNWMYSSNHFVNDLDPKSKCCSSTKYCNLYYELRPTGSCYRKSPYKFGAFWGDPHFSTLDGLNFTFNGLGEYTLLRIRTWNCSFDLQARTEIAVKINGSLADATIFTAFAAKDRTSSVHIERNRNHDGMNIYGNEVDLTKQYYDNEDEMEFSKDGNVSISKRNDSVNIYFSSCDISLSISLNIEMLTLKTSVPVSLKTVTKGLLGNYNDDANDDFIMPNGSVLMSNITEREIFEFGKTWGIDQNDSAFRYDEGKTHFDFHNDSYTPRFLDEIDEEVKKKAVGICKDINDRECIFDFAFTENAQIAQETHIFKGNLSEDKMEIEETVPFLDGCSSLYVTRGQESVCKLEVEVGDTIQLVSNNTEAKIDQTASTITITPSSNEPISIRVAALNEKGRISPEFVFNILMCTGCSNRGVCIESVRNDARENEYFRYYACKCDQGYDGIDCESTFDGCAASPCSLDRNCTTLTPDKQQETNRSYICDPCPEGYMEEGVDDCIDEDECDGNNGGCDQQCINTEGSFECSCIDGYKVSGNDKNKCIDIDECEELSDNCSHLCNNTDGGFTCQCFNGYEYNGTSCIQISDVSCDNECDSAHGCTIDDSNIPECFCNSGYELDDTGIQCLDIDECSLNICPQDCTNTNGSFRCSCFIGYHLEGISTCKECESTFWGEDCKQECLCNGRGASHCHHIRGCVCESGWFGNNCDEDINECEFKVNPCNDPKQTCLNTLGSYHCDCRPGFSLTDQGTCSDSDECLEPYLNNCSQECINTIGSYSCGCEKGFTKTDEVSCKDINECELGLSNCEQRCVNNEGQYSCFCYYGYTLNDDRRTCTKIEDPCFSINNLTCSHFCMLTYETAVCGCKTGYMLQQDHQTCTDINECSDNGINDCDWDATCENTQGSYLCQCPVGKRLENDARTCTDCDSYHYGQDCSQTCSCLNGICDKKTGCVCDPGWAGISCETDIDECSTGQVMCQQNHSTCINVPVRAFCLCDNGYQNISGICQDINECVDVSLHECDHVCTNTEGSFVCSCHSGFVFDTTCTDIDECSSGHDCDQVCENSIGSYRCSCNEGYRLDLSNRQTCIPLHDCTDEQNETCPNHSTCSVKDGDVQCQCLKGYQKVAEQCQDINECQGFNLCTHNCSNTPGSFVCSCDVGFSLLSDKVTCKECDKWKFGSNCETDCSCNQIFTDSCDSVTGECKCKTGVIGNNCDTDIEECQYVSTCPNNSNCTNTFGSFTCNCIDGYFKTGSNECEECDFRHFGKSCQEECHCYFENTEECHHVTGVCKCKQGWEGHTCRDDEDECSYNTSICSDKQWSTCANLNGSFKCECDEGFTDNIHTCEDIDECKDIAKNECDQLCVNIPGSFKCSCEDGYAIENTTCKECQQWSYGYNCSSLCSCNQSNTDVCDLKTGQCVCYDGWNGTNCETDINECWNETVCPSNSSCENSAGSFDCVCNNGFKKTMDDSCEKCQQWSYGYNCSSVCSCNQSNAESCDSKSGQCVCYDGWNGTNCRTDINECLNDTVCPHNSTCYNTEGNFDCICNIGFTKMTNGSCEKCQQWSYGYNCSSLCSCNQSNTELCDSETGQCVCYDGWNGTNCKTDVNECLNDTVCPPNSSCNNTEGNFDCICNIGYTKTANRTCEICTARRYGYNCTLKCDCEEQNTRECYNINGSCTCLKGWQGSTCNEDIDECEMNPSLCQSKVNSSCYNTNGSYDCYCNDGFREQGDQCTDCDEWTFDTYCQSSCGCNVTLSDYCNANDGTCKCKDGWDGVKCEDDIDECRDNKTCPENSNCTNSLGTFECVCLDGFFLDESKSCSECGNNTYGSNCTKLCDCISKNAASENQTCDTVTGQCKCGSNWEGAKCQMDVNECSTDSKICNQLENTTCVNTVGSYLCDCKRGFVHSNEGNCIDDERKPPIKPEMGIWIKANVVVEIDLPADINIQASSVHNDVQYKLKEMLLEYFRTFTDSVFDVIVINVKFSSIIADYIITSNNTDDNNLTLQFAAGIIKLGKGTQLMYDRQLVNVSSDTFHSQDACQILLLIGGNCGEDFSCKVEDGVPVCSIKSDPPEVSWTLVISLSAGGLGVIIIVALLVVAILLLRRRSDTRKRASERTLSVETNSTRRNDDGSDFYRNYKWQNGEAIDTGIRPDPLFKLPRYKTHTQLNESQASLGAIGSSEPSSEIRRLNWM